MTRFTTTAVPFEHTVSDGGRTFTGRRNFTGDGSWPAGTPLVVAVHGGTYTSAYFDVPGCSLLARAADAGQPVIAVDRPGYGGSTAVDGGESIILRNAELLDALIGELWARDGAGASGVVLIGHSIGGAVATAIAAAAPSWPLIGLATSGCLVDVPPASRAAWDALPDVLTIDLPVPLKDDVMFGPAETHALGMPEAGHVANAPVPRAELIDITNGWVERMPEVVARIAVPVHHRQGEFDKLWITDGSQVEAYRDAFRAAPSVDARLLDGAGHCIDFHRPGAAFQEEQLAFARACAAGA